MERSEGQTKTIQSWESGTITKPPNGEHKKVRGKVDMTLRGIRKDEAGRVQAIRH
jgi:hypothetical protein